MTRRATPPPIGLGRAQAAAYIGADEALFVRLVEAGTMPKPRTLRGMQLWDAEELADAFRRLPRWAPPHWAQHGDTGAERDRGAKPAEGISGRAAVYTPKTLAERWECSEHHVRNMIDRGELPAFCIGRLPRVRGEDVEAHERQSGDSPASQVNSAFSPRTLAERWACTEQHVRNMVKRGELPAFRLDGKLLRIKGVDVEAFERSESEVSEKRPASPEATEQKSDVSTVERETRKMQDILFRARMRKLRAQWAREQQTSGK